MTSEQKALDLAERIACSANTAAYSYKKMFGFPDWRTGEKLYIEWLQREITQVMQPLEEELTAANARIADLESQIDKRSRQTR